MWPKDITRGLESAGFNASSLDKIRLARGVVGKTSYVAAAAIFGLIVVAWSLRDPNYLLAIGALIVLIFIAYFIGVLFFANKHPGEALLEGAELIRWRQLEMAAKDVPEIVQQSNAGPTLLGPDKEE